MKIKKKNLIIAIVIFLILGFVGVYILGEKVFKRETEKSSPQEPSEKIRTLEEATEVIQTIKELQKSELITSQSILAKGEVSEILDRAVVLAAQEEKLEIPIEKEANITIPALIREGKKVQEQKEIKFEDIKIGDNLKVFVELVDDRLEAGDVLVSPRATKSVQKPKKVLHLRSIVEGEISQISDRSLTLATTGEDFIVSIRDGAYLALASHNTSPGKRIDFEDISVGDRVSILMEVGDKKSEGIQVTILP